MMTALRRLSMIRGEKGPPVSVKTSLLYTNRRPLCSPAYITPKSVCPVPGRENSANAH